MLRQSLFTFLLCGTWFCGTGQPPFDARPGVLIDTRTDMACTCDSSKTFGPHTLGTDTVSLTLSDRSVIGEVTDSAGTTATFTVSLDPETGEIIVSGRDTNGQVFTKRVGEKM